MSDSKQKQEPPKVEATVIRKLDGVLAPEFSLDPSVARPQSLEYEDEFQSVYGFDYFGTGVIIIEPTYNPMQLELLCTQNNAIGPCIEAMVTNIDGTGYSVEARENKNVSDKILEQIEGFFEEPFPGESFITLRKKLRNDLERTGNAYVEVIRNVKGEVMFLKHVESKTMRLVTLDDPVVAERFVTRGGKQVGVKIALRQRRFVQKVVSTYTYFKEFGAERDLDKNTGKWETEGNKLPAQKRANEIIHFTVHKDPKTPYGVPRWIAQTPSVLGSRGAEEHNLAFFESGGLPPMLVIVHGGALTKNAQLALSRILNSKGSIKHKGAVLEAHSSSGSLDSSNNVRVTVERFGSERQNDSMFENYDDKCEQRVRRAFRLPPLFVGKSEDYNYATAFASYTVAEAQVFSPEREEFDEIINLKLMPAITQIHSDVWFKSMPLSVKDVTQQIEALKLAIDKNAIDREELIRILNEIVNMDMEYSEEEDQFRKDMLQNTINNSGNDKQKDGVPPGANKNVPVQAPSKDKKSDYTGIHILAEDAAKLMKTQKSGSAYVKLMENVGTLSKDERSVFKTVLAAELYGFPLHDTYGTEDIAMDALEVMAKNA